MDKKEARKIIKERIAGLTNEYIDEASGAITENVLATDSYKNCRSFFCYVSMKNEPSTITLLQKALDDGKKVFVPKCYPGNIMKPIRIKSLDVLKPGMLDILEPEDENEVLDINKDSIDLSIIPCISASLDGKRLGHGAGYYDRYLQQVKTEKMCLCFGKLLFDDIPMTDMDIWMDLVISE